MSRWQRYRRALLKRMFKPGEAMSYEPVPKELLDGLFYAWAKTGNFAKLFQDARANARREKRPSDVALYDGMAEQLGDTFGQSR